MIRNRIDWTVSKSDKKEANTIDLLIGMGYFSFAAQLILVWKSINISKNGFIIIIYRVEWKMCNRNFFFCWLAWISWHSIRSVWSNTRKYTYTKTKLKRPRTKRRMIDDQKLTALNNQNMLKYSNQTIALNKKTQQPQQQQRMRKRTKTNPNELKKNG